MNLLFSDIPTEATAQLKELLGFLDKDISYVNMKSDIKTASRDIYDLVGKEVYTLAENALIANPQVDVHKELLYMLRYPIACNAYLLFAPSNDLSHTNNGRKMRVDEHIKLPFEWMLDRDNAAIEKRYYRACDDLLRYLDDLPTGNIKTAWQDSDSFKESHRLFLRTVKDFDRFFLIKNRFLMLKLMPGIDDCEQYEIRSRIGIDKFDQLKAKTKANQVTDLIDIELLKLIKKACVMYSMAWAMPRLSVNLFPDGILQHVTSDKATTRGEKPTLKSETEAARQAFSNDASRVFIEIENLVKPAPINETQEQTNITPIYGNGFFSA